MNAEFLLTSLIVVASPGTGALVTVAAGLQRGTRAALVAALGCTLGIVPHMLAAVTGLVALMNASALAFAAVKYAGVAYLLWMAWATLRAGGPLQVEAEGRARSDLQVIRDAILVNLLNPKLSIFFLAFLPQFIAADEVAPTLTMLQLSAVFMAMTLAVFAIYGVFAAALRDRILSQGGVLKWMRRGFAAAFVGLGVKLVLVQR